MGRNYYLVIAGLTGLIAVAIGAFGAHALKPNLSAYQIDIFTTANRYHFYHAIVLLAISLSGLPFKLGIGKWAFITILIGIVFFSGSLYLLATKQLLGIESFSSVLGPITPIGGLFLIIGWGLLVVYGFKHRT